MKIVVVPLIIFWCVAFTVIQGVPSPSQNSHTEKDAETIENHDIKLSKAICEEMDLETFLKHIDEVFDGKNTSTGTSKPAGAVPASKDEGSDCKVTTDANTNNTASISEQSSFKSKSFDELIQLTEKRVIATHDNLKPILEKVKNSWQCQSYLALMKVQKIALSITKISKAKEKIVLKGLIAEYNDNIAALLAAKKNEIKRLQTEIDTVKDWKKCDTKKTITKLQDQLNLFIEAENAQIEKSSKLPELLQQKNLAEQMFIEARNDLPALEKVINEVAKVEKTDKVLNMEISNQVETTLNDATVSGGSIDNENSSQTIDKLIQFVLKKIETAESELSSIIAKLQVLFPNNQCYQGLQAIRKYQKQIDTIAETAAKKESVGKLLSDYYDSFSKFSKTKHDAFNSAEKALLAYLKKIRQLPKNADASLIPKPPIQKSDIELFRKELPYLQACNYMVCSGQSFTEMKNRFIPLLEVEKSLLILNPQLCLLIAKKETTGKALKEAKAELAALQRVQKEAFYPENNEPSTIPSNVESPQKANKVKMD